MRCGDEATLGQPDPPGGLELARPTSSTPRTRPSLEALREHGLLAPRRAADAGRGAQRATAPPQGDWVGVSGARLGARLQHLPAAAVAAAELDPRTGRAALQGQGRLRPLGDRLPAADHLDRQAQGQRRRGTLAEGAEGERRDLPGQRDASSPQVNNGAERARPDQPLLLVPPARARKAGGMHSALHYFAPGDPGDLRRRLGRGGPEVEPPPGRGAALPRVPGQPRRAGGARPQRQLRVPAAPGGAAAGRSARRSPSCSPRR